MVRAVAVLALAALAAGGAVESAAAATASGRPAQFTAAPGERNDLTVDNGAGGDARFSDTGAPIIPGLFCLPIPLGQLTCDPDGDPRDTDGGGVGVDLGDGDDRAIVRGIPGTDTRPGAIRVLGAAGNDYIENLANGLVTLDGATGDDTLLSSPTAGALLLGGSGADAMSASGLDAVASYADHAPTGVRVTLDKTANDGSSGERDDVRTSGVVGSGGPDVLIGDAGPNALTGSAGDDRLEGGAGDDRIDAVLSTGALTYDEDGTDTVACGIGNDEVIAGPRDKVAADCELTRVGPVVGPGFALVTTAPRASSKGLVALTYRVAVPSAGNRVRSRSTVRFVDSKGNALSTTGRFVLGDGADVARIRVTLNRTTRRRLARSRSGRLTLVARRVSRDASPDSTATGYEQVNAPLTVRRPAG